MKSICALHSGGVEAIYQYLLSGIETDYETVRTLKRGPRGSVVLLRHRQSGTRYIFRQYQGSGEVYRKLLTVSCPNLPQIMEAAEQDGSVAVLEEYIRGDSLAFLLEGACLTPAQARDITRQLCSALWVLHAMGAVHRDIKPENVILRGSEAVLIDFDASRLFKSGTAQDTQVLGTTGYAAPEQYGIDAMAAGRGISSDLSTLCTVLAIFVPIVPPILIQSKLNEIVTVSPAGRRQAAGSTADELKKFKDLLDSGAITQEEFDAKKKELLGL